MIPPLTVVALGGNALIAPGRSEDFAAQGERVELALRAVTTMLARGERVLLVHGNGPQVGAALLRTEAARREAYALPLDACVAQTQGETGYLIAQRLEALLAAAGQARQVACLVTRVEVDSGDPRLSRADKPVGPWYAAAERHMLEARGWNLVADARRGLRRVVPSPLPLRVLETESIRALLDAGAVVIGGGGGGIPVCASAAGGQRGIEAVVDKDHTAALLAAGLGARRMLNLTAVDQAMLDYGTAAARGIDEMSAAEARRHLAAGHFAPGSMGPKIESAIRFLEAGGESVRIVTPERAQDEGAGTLIRA